MLSTGIDIGTTTTQIVFSRITLADKARPGYIPRVEIMRREVLYESPIVFTPLLDAETIDARALAALIREEYDRAGISPAQVETGAAIITGETAKKKNADEILTSIAGLAGDFVVTVAGPHVESMIAGRGSGAGAYSKAHYTSVTNVDIGGGSSNSAVFRLGELQAAAAMNYGGRILEIEHASGRIRSLTQPARVILAHLGLNLREGDIPELFQLTRITNCMAELTLELIEGTTSPLAQKLYLTAPSPVSGKGKALMFSGGIGYYYYNPLELSSLADITRHDDIGPLLAQSLRLSPDLRSYSVLPPAETMRATVLGASSQLITLSGSTIWAEDHLLPIKNVPVICPDLAEFALNPRDIQEAVASAIKRWDIDVHQDPFVVNLDLQIEMDYAHILKIANGLSAFGAGLPMERPLIVVVQRDYARVLGQTIKSILPDRPLVVIDQVGLEEGDYIDIGAPIMDGRVVPLMVKTLVFYH
jgi:ethanolamine utilization protein EutA